METLHYSLKSPPLSIGMKLGMNNVVPPFLAPTTKGAAILNGVNYASGGAGILNDTGRIFVRVFSLLMSLNLRRSIQYTLHYIII